MSELPPPPPPPPTDTAAPRYASFGQRVGGLLIDNLVLLPVLIVTIVARRYHVVTLHLPNGRTRHHLVSHRLPVLTSLLLAVPLAAYPIAFIAVRGRTLGQQAMRLRVVPEAGGGPVGWARALRRWAVIGVPSLIVTIVHVRPLGTLIGLWVMVVFLWMQIDDSKRGLHDKAAGVVVLREG